jgi:FdhE protein
MVSYETILEALSKEAEERPQLAETISLYAKLVEAQATVAPGDGRPSLERDEALARLGRGEPLFSVEQLEIDAKAFADLCSRVGFTLAQSRREFVKQLALIHAWLREHADDMGRMATDYLREGRVRRGEEAGLESEFLSFIFSNSLRPFLRLKAEQYAELIDDSLWYRNRCPICGGEPDLAALERKSGRRRLLCSRCDFEWGYVRLACPFCGNEDPAELGYYPSEDKVYRLGVCDRCHRYLKTIDLREAKGERLLPAERVLTIGMDFAAQKAGYKAG